MKIYNVILVHHSADDGYIYVNSASCSTMEKAHEMKRKMLRSFIDGQENEGEYRMPSQSVLEYSTNITIGSAYLADNVTIRIQDCVLDNEKIEYHV